MKLEQQFCSKEQGKKIEELRVKAKSYFVWAYEICVTIGDDELIIVPRVATNLCIGSSYRNIIAAYSSAELDVLLPKPNLGKEGYYCVNTYPFPEMQFPKDKRDEYRRIWRDIYSQHAKNLANPETVTAHAKADLLIELIKHELIKPEGLKL